MSSKDDELLLTPEELSSKSYNVCYGCPSIEGTTEHCRECRRYMNLAIKAQLAKAKPIIEKQERERIKALGFYIDKDSEVQVGKGDFVIRECVKLQALKEVNDETADR